jgi:triosephosphate isomerase
MLEDLGCRYVLIGHSERRQSFGDSDPRIAAKLERVLPSSVCALLCVGETLAERDAGAVAEVLERQLTLPIRRVAESGRPASRSFVVAYEPVWAIGTGRVATPDLAQAAHAQIRRRLVAGLGEEGERVRILYGGSLKPANARSLLEQPDVDGALVGGASLDPNDFSSIVSTCRETHLERS